MNSIIDNILKKIKSLPPLDTTVVQIQKICTDKNSSLSDLSKIIEKDPVLTLNILKAANSPMYGFCREIKTPTQAVALFGMGTVRGFALASAINKSFKIDLSPYNISPDQFLEISSLQSVFAFRWYSKIDRSMLNVIQPAAFMLEVGKIIIANELLEIKKDVEFKERLKNCHTSIDISNLEKELVGITNEEIAAKIFSHWNLEDDICKAILHSNIPSLADAKHIPYATALSVVKNTVSFLGRVPSKKGLDHIYNVLSQYKLSQEHFDETLNNVQQA